MLRFCGMPSKVWVHIPSIHSALMKFMSPSCTETVGREHMSRETCWFSGERLCCLFFFNLRKRKGNFYIILVTFHVSLGDFPLSVPRTIVRKHFWVYEFVEEVNLWLFKYIFVCILQQIYKLCITCHFFSVVIVLFFPREYDFHNSVKHF